MYYCALSLGVLQHTPQCLVTCAIWCVWSTVSVNFLLRKYYIKNILITLHRYGIAAD